MADFDLNVDSLIQRLLEGKKVQIFFIRNRTSSNKVKKKSRKFVLFFSSLFLIL